MALTVLLAPTRAVGSQMCRDLGLNPHGPEIILITAEQSRAAQDLTLHDPDLVLEMPGFTESRTGQKIKRELLRNCSDAGTHPTWHTPKP